MAPRQMKEYTLEEIRRHTKREDAWIILHGKVESLKPYRVTVVCMAHLSVRPAMLQTHEDM